MPKRSFSPGKAGLQVLLIALFATAALQAADKATRAKDSSTQTSSQTKSSQATEAAAAAITRALNERYPQAKIADVQPAPVPGLYAVFMSDNTVAYSDATGDYLMVGKLLDTRTRKDVSVALVDARKPVEFAKLPFERAIKIVKGNGSRQLAVFEDPDCPYCQQFEKELQSVDDLTEYVFLFPLTDVHPKALAHARAIWCSPDKADAWTVWMKDRKEPAAGTCANDPIAENSQLADKINVNGTPTLVFPDGQRVRGTLNEEQLQALLNSTNATATANAGEAPRTGG
jgi:thiol:disulfide interchange protein DsbC